MSTADYADRFIFGAELQANPWAEPEVISQDQPEYQAGKLRLAAFYAGGGLWGIFVGIACWWAYEFATVAETAPLLALN